MRLTDTDLASVPGAAAWYDSVGSLVATTREWQGHTPGTVPYRAGDLTLFSTPMTYDANVSAICTRLINTLARAGEHAQSGQRIRLQMVLASLRLILGQHVAQAGTTDDVVVAVGAALELSNPPLIVDCQRYPCQACPSPALVALALKQLATNAQRHGGATRLSLAISDGPTFQFRWEGSPLAQPIATSRHPSRRARWGAGFARLAADAVGAVIYDPVADLDGGITVTFAIQQSDLQLRLPLALVDPIGTVARATRSWDEETHALPGQRLTDQQATLAMQRAGVLPGRTAVAGAFAARATPAGVWVALLPADAHAQAADLVSGLAHEHDLLRVPEPHRTEVLGLAAVLRCCLGRIPEPWDSQAIAGPYRTAAVALGLPTPTLVVPTDASCAPDPLLTAFLVSEVGGSPRWDATMQRWMLMGPDLGRSPTLSDALIRAGGPVFLT